jgi:Cu2+-containing amine oxidase
MLTVRLSRQHLRGVVSVCFTAGVLLWGCASEQASQLPQPPIDVSKRLAPLEECVARSQRAVTMAAEAGVSAGTLAPANSSIADAQDALDEVKKLTQQGKPQEAVERATKGLEECEKVDAMVAKARQDTAERKARAQLATEAETRIAQTATCVDGARQAVRSMSTVRTKNVDVATAKSALDSAEAGLKQARELLAQNDPQGALRRLDTVQTDCQTAQTAGEKAATQGKPASAPVKPRRSQ